MLSLLLFVWLALRRPQTKRPCVCIQKLEQCSLVILVKHAIYYTQNKSGKKILISRF
jgi:hypothetical protein